LLCLKFTDEKPLILSHFSRPHPKPSEDGAAFLPLYPSCRAVRAEYRHQASACAIAQNAETKFSSSLIEKRKMGARRIKNVEENFVEA
jgi:hypothetical protein